MKNILCRIHRTILSVMAMRECLNLRSKCVYEIPVYRTLQRRLGGAFIMSKGGDALPLCGSQGSNDMDIESDDIEVSDSVTVLWEVR